MAHKSCYDRYEPLYWFILAVFVMYLIGKLAGVW